MMMMTMICKLYCSLVCHAAAEYPTCNKIVSSLLFVNLAYPRVTEDVGVLVTHATVLH